MKFYSLRLLSLFVMLIGLRVFATEVPQFILDDLQHEINEADYIQQNKEQRAAIIQQLKTQKNQISFEDLRVILLSHFSQDIGKFLSDSFEQKYQVQDKAHLIKVLPEQIALSQKHAIHDLASYIGNRLGQGTFQQLQSEKIETIVIGGQEKRIDSYLSAFLKGGQYSIIKIPSLYEAWGLVKYYIPAQNNQKAKLLWIVPPAWKYLRHYVTLFESVSSGKAIGFMDPIAVENYKKQMQINAQKLYLNHKIDYLAFGYDKVWIQEIQKRADLEIIRITNHQDFNLGVSIKVIDVFSKAQQTQFSIGVFASNLTVWGELAAWHMQSYLRPDLKGVFFLGSAGSIDSSINPYDLSVPSKFYLPGQKLTTENVVFEWSQTQNVRMTGLRDLQIHMGTRHGNTYSPIEQNKNYLNTLVKKGLQTVDVEQSIIAQVIGEYNRLNQSKIKFGAVNLITDKPYAILEKTKSVYSLDNLNYELKQNSRKAAVSIVLNSLLYDFERDFKAKQGSEVHLNSHSQADVIRALTLSQKQTSQNKSLSCKSLF